MSLVLVAGLAADDSVSSLLGDRLVGVVDQLIPPRHQTSTLTFGPAKFGAVAHKPVLPS